MTDQPTQRVGWFTRLRATGCAERMPRLTVEGMTTTVLAAIGALTLPPPRCSLPP